MRTFGHLPYGDSWYESGTPDKWKFTTYERDSAAGETGLDYAKFRYYASGQGRFMSADLLAGHISAPQSLNRYAYAQDPINNADPLGLSLVTVCTIGIVPTEVSQFAGNDPHFSVTYGLLCDEVDVLDGGGGIPTPLGRGDGGGGIQGPNNPNNVDLNDLRARLWKALMSDGDCLTFLGSRVGGILGLLDRIPIDFQNVGSVSVQAVTSFSLDPGSDRPQDPQIHVNTNGLFAVKGLATNVGGTIIRTGTPLFQALTMFHELGHAFGVLRDDRGSDDESHQNSEIIKDKCKKALSTFESK